MRTIVSVLLIFLIAFTALPVAAASIRRPTVYIDQSREFLFRLSWDLARMLRERYVVTVGECTLTPEVLAPYDVLILPVSRQVGYTAQELVAIEDFLKRGGGVLVLDFSRSVSEPAHQILAHLQVPLRGGSTAAVGELTSGAQGPLGVTATGKTINILGSGFEVTVTDRNQRPVLVEGGFGAGRLAVAGDEGILLTNDYSKLTAGALELVERLAGNLSGEPRDVIPDRLYPEHTLQHGTITLYYSQVLAQYVEFLVEHADEAFDFIGKLHGHELPAGLRVVLLACAGSGYSAHGEVGIGVLGEAANVIDVFGHELTHEWVWPAKMPSSIEEGWASLAGARLCAYLGFDDYAQRQQASYANAFERTKAELGHLDLLTGHQTEGVHWAGHMGKTMYLVKRAEELYGPTFTPDFFTLAIERIQRGEASSPLTIEDIARIAGTLLQMDPELVYDHLRGAAYIEVSSPKAGAYVRGDLPLEVRIPQGKDHRVRVALNDQELYVGPWEPLVIDTTVFPDGEYRLTLELFAQDTLVNRQTLTIYLDNWQRVEDHLRPPLESPWFGTVKQSRYLDCTPGWRHDTDRAQDFFGDAHRLTCVGEALESVIYAAVEVREFAVTVYAKGDSLQGILAVEVSPDQVEWSPLPYEEEVVEVAGDWRKVIISGRELPSAGTSFLRITVDGSQVPPENVVLGYVEYIAKVE